MLQRAIWDSLLEWKNRKHHPLLISGLRQVGKTYIVKEFGKRYYDQVVYLDLRANDTVRTAFDGNFDVDQMVMAISANVFNTHFEPYHTLIILDEIQDCPNARSSLKYWDLDGRYDVIATGSFLGVKGFRGAYKRGIPVGYEESITMFPLTFREFLVNVGIGTDVLEYVQSCIAMLTPIQQAVHESMRSLYLQYLIVGGMPEAVNVFLRTHDLNQVRQLQKNILTSIRDDFGRYKDSEGKDQINQTLKLRAEACLDSLPAQLSKDYKKFQYSLVQAKGHSTEKADGLQYLVDCGLVIKSYNLREISTPLEAAKIATEFKVFMADTGLLNSMFDQGTAALILEGKLGAYKGAVAENMVAAALASSNHALYYLHAPNGSPELDFISTISTEPVIIECKSTNNRATSMKYVLSHPEKYGNHIGIKIADANIGSTGLYNTYPLYAIGFIPTDNPSLTVPEIRIKLP